MKPRLIKTEDDYNQALARIDELMDAKMGSPEGDELELLSALVEMYEEKHYPISLPDPIDAVMFRMEQAGLSQKDLVPFIGSKSKVSEVLNRKRPLTLSMMRALHKGLGIPAEVLLNEPAAVFPTDFPEIEWGRFPIAQMVKQGWVSCKKGYKDKSEEIMRAFILKAGGSDAIPSVAFKKGFGSRVNPRADRYALMAWCWQVLIMAQERQLERKFKPNSIDESFLRNVARLCLFDEGPLLAREFLEKNGIHFIILPHLDKAYLDGASMLMPDGAPVIAMTLRHDRLDNFWFVLIHELVHVAKHLSLSQQQIIVDDMDLRSMEIEVDDQIEKEADAMAEEILIPQETRSTHFKLWDENNPLKGRQLGMAVLSLASSMQVHPAIIAGAVRFQRKNYKLLHHMVGQGQVRVQFLGSN
ncbi:ImmA/IrrE family metallo-endopeptidase [Desulfatibacillum aliphaticivorans]|uniref:ImmA/IrrE family metallo-endopeptidase n=1 Tax=Desulfatibacillum aliphaticivorans TaxID=218208 RepID=UPI000417DEFF|nr:ImmA/IrrE family metallo-endopeptidase [Desulfatibacillum aliphaticivorans]